VPSDLLPFISTDFPRAASLIALMMEAVQTCETLLNSYKSTRLYSPQDSDLQEIYSLCFLSGISMLSIDFMQQNFISNHVDFLL
jgi:hypothetical protein